MLVNSEQPASAAVQAVAVEGIRNSGKRASLKFGQAEQSCGLALSRVTALPQGPSWRPDKTPLLGISDLQLLLSFAPVFYCAVPVVCRAALPG